MKHFTCDKCGMPMESEKITVINNVKYHIDSSCLSNILSGLQGKGEVEQSLNYFNNFQNFKDKYYAD